MRTEIERSRAEAALRSSEEQYRAIFDASADALVLWDSTPRRVDVNAAYERIHGFTREEVLRSDYRAGMPAQYAKRRRELVQRTLAGTPCAVELETLRKSGERIEVEVRTIPVQYRGQPHVLAIIRDVTERKRIEATARASEEQYREIFNVSIDGMALWDDSGRIADVNPAFVEMHGFDRAEIEGADCAMFIPAEGREGCMRLVRTALAGERSQGEHVTRHKSGLLRNMEIRAIPVRYHGRPHALTLVRDITNASSPMRPCAEARRSIGRCLTPGRMRWCCGTRIFASWTSTLLTKDLPAAGARTSLASTACSPKRPSRRARQGAAWARPRGRVDTAGNATAKCGWYAARLGTARRAHPAPG